MVSPLRKSKQMMMKLNPKRALQRTFTPNNLDPSLAGKNPTSSKVIETSEGDIKYSVRRPRPKIRKFPCPWCQEKFQQLKLFQAHVKEEHKDVEYKCQFCDRTFKTYGGKRKHEILHLPPRHFCEYCEKGYHFLNELKEYRRYHTKEDLEECDQCHKKFVSKRYLKKHMKSHENEGKRFKCDQCIRTCSSELNLKQHVRGAHGEGFTALCGKKFDWPPKYQRHLRKCTDCEKVRIEQRRKKYDIMSKAKHYFLHSV